MSGNSLRQTVHTHRASIHRAAKLVEAVLRVAGVTADLAESNGTWQPTAGFMTRVTCRLTAKNRDQLQDPTLGNRLWATSTFLHYLQCVAKEYTTQVPTISLTVVVRFD